MDPTAKRDLRLLVFNLATDADDPILWFSAAWIRALEAHSAYIDVLTMRKGQVDFGPGVRVYSLGKEYGWSKPRRAVRFYQLLSRLLVARDYDVCFAHMAPLFAIMGRPLLRARGVPTVLWYAHGTTSATLRVAERRVDRVVTSSREGFRLASDKVIVTGQGIDTHLYSPPDRERRGERPFTIVTVGRLSPVKRIEVLVDVAETLVTSYALTDLEVRVVGPVGDGGDQYLRSLHAQIAARHLTRHFTFVGPVSPEGLRSEYCGADLLVNTSATGSLDKVVLEAMSCGTPVVSSNAPYESILSAVDPELFVRAGDSDKLARACVRISSMSAEGRSDLGERLRNSVLEGHSLDRLTTRLTEEVFRPLIRSGSYEPG